MNLSACADNSTDTKKKLKEGEREGWSWEGLRGKEGREKWKENDILKKLEGVGPFFYAYHLRLSDQIDLFKIKPRYTRKNAYNFEEKKQ